MSDVIRFQDHKRKANNDDYPIIKKIVDGEVIECVNLDALSPAQYQKYLSQFSSE